MNTPDPAPPSRPLAFGAIAVTLVIAAAAFAYTGGWLSPGRITPAKLVDLQAPPEGPALGHRRNHTKGICFTGLFQANGAGAALTRARVLAAGAYPVVGRFNLASSELAQPDGQTLVRGLGLRITAPDGSQWRTAMLTAPFFPVSTPEDFYALLQAGRSKGPGAMKAFAASHPGLATFGAWAASAPWTGSYAENRFNSIDSFVFTDARGADHIVRWSLLPQSPPVAVTPADLAKGGPDVLFPEIAARVARGPVRYALVVILAEPVDAVADPNKAWPESRRSVQVGTLVVQAVQAERDGPCRDINYDPTVLPPGMKTSADPFPAARSAAYSRSFDRRAAEAADYPRTLAAGRS